MYLKACRRRKTRRINRFMALVLSYYGSGRADLDGLSKKLSKGLEKSCRVLSCRRPSKEDVMKGLGKSLITANQDGVIFSYETITFDSQENPVGFNVKQVEFSWEELQRLKEALRSQVCISTL